MLSLFILLCGCKGEKTITPITKGLEFTLVVTCDKTSYDISAVVDQGGCLKAKVNSPKVISGMEIYCNKFETLAKYRQLEYNYNEDEFAGNNCVVAVYNIL